MTFYLQAKTVGSYLHRITREKDNEPQNDLIREFSLQVIHEPIQITANGFFNIDFDLLGSVRGEYSNLLFTIHSENSLFVDGCSYNHLLGYSHSIRTKRQGNTKSVSRQQIIVGELIN